MKAVSHNRIEGLLRFTLNLHESVRTANFDLTEDMRVRQIGWVEKRSHVGFEKSEEESSVWVRVYRRGREE